MDKDGKVELHSLLDVINAKRLASSTENEPNGSQNTQQGPLEDGQRSNEEDNRIKELAKHGIYLRYSRTTLDGIKKRGLPDNPSIRENFQHVSDYVSHLESHIRRGEGLVMMGPVGTMKTQMAVGILRWQIDGGGGGMMVAMATLLDNLYTMNAMNKEECVRYEKRLYQTPLLVVDDLGAEYNSPDWIKAKIDSIISHRYDHMKATIITTNCSAQEMKDTYGGRIFDRIKSNAYYLQFKGGSERKELDISTI